jgi:hypothetical protein
VSDPLRELDRRRFVRFPVALQVRGRAEELGEVELEGTVGNVSRGGLMAELVHQVRHGSTVYLTLHAGEERLPVEGRVVWVDSSGQGIRHGVAFPDPREYFFALQVFLSAFRGAAGTAIPESDEAFEAWLLRQASQAEEAGEVPRGLIRELQGELQAARQRGEDAGRAIVVRQVADLAGIDRKLAAEVLDTFEAQRTVPRDVLMQRIAEAWLEGRRRAHEREGA